MSILRFVRIAESEWRIIKSNESIRESKFKNIPNSSETVFPGDFFSFWIVSAAVWDWDFIDSELILRNFGCEFGFKAETVAREGQGVINFFTEDLVASFHVGQV